MREDLSNRLSVERIEDDGVLDVLKDEWNNLLARSRSNTVFLTWEWIEAWWRCFRGQERLWLLVVKNSDGATVGIAPLYLDLERGVGGVPLRCLRFVADRSAGSEYLDFIIAREYERQVFDALLEYLEEEHSSWDKIGRAHV